MYTEDTTIGLFVCSNSRAHSHKLCYVQFYLLRLRRIPFVFHGYISVRGKRGNEGWTQTYTYTQREHHRYLNSITRLLYVYCIYIRRHNLISGMAVEWSN
jgi:hypothetical protein